MIQLAERFGTTPWQLQKEMSADWLMKIDAYDEERIRHSKA